MHKQGVYASYNKSLMQLVSHERGTCNVNQGSLNFALLGFRCGVRRLRHFVVKTGACERTMYWSGLDSLGA